METADRARLMRLGAGIALAGNALLAAVKIALGLRGGSLAVVGDGIDSSVDVLIAVMSLVVARVVARPADESHPWGHGRAETVATALLACVLFFAGAQLILNSALSLARGEERAVPGGEALAAALLSIAGKILLAASQFWLGRKAASPMLTANGKNMAGDVALSGGVLAGVWLSMRLALPFIDTAVTILVGLWVLRSAVGIFAEANLELMDGAAAPEAYQALFDAVRTVGEAGNPHRARMRRIAGLWDIDIDIEVRPDMTVSEAHRVTRRVEKAIKERVEGVYDIVVHVEPAGNREFEGFGLREKSRK
ncbi:MAG: cation diffusion facilitator family transporter [Treponematales bacterium]